jgi:molybdopterin-containing oxidoreductase family iron-sulfur binding subunit
MPSRSTDGLDLTALRARLAGQRGPRYWRCLEELAETPEFQDYLRREFPSDAYWTDPASRRTFLRLMGASLALAGVGVSGCSSEPPEKIVPYVRAPEEIVPGRPLWFASAVGLGGFATGVLVESHMGRPTFVAGNEKHPDSLGAIDPFAQATVLTLYDPDRSQGVMQGAKTGTWDNFLLAAVEALDAQRAKQGAGLHVLTETVTSPTLARQLRALKAAFPKLVWHQYEPVNRDNARDGALLVYGEDVATRYQLDKANVIVALDADPLASGPGRLRYARDFAARREPGPSGINRLYAVEASPSVTGAMADHRLAIPARKIAGFAHSLAKALGVEVPPPPGGALSAREEKWIAALVRDLQKNKGASVVIAGDGQKPVVHALAHTMNQVLGNVGKTVVHTAPVEEEPVKQLESLRALVRDLDAGQVDALFILGGNPVYTAPADFTFADRLKKAKFSAHVSLYNDETSAACRWHVPLAHELETWGDLRAFDGTATIQQPLIAPLYGGHSAAELIAALLKDPNRGSYEIVRETWKQTWGEKDFEARWRTAVHDGIVAGSERPAKEVALKEKPPAPMPAPSSGELELVFRPDPTIWDGRFANNGWLQELHKPWTKLTWDNAVLVSVKTAERLGLKTDGLTGESTLVALRHGDYSVVAPVWVTPGHADDSVTVHLGYGRTRAGRVGNGAGFNAYTIRTSNALEFVSGLEITRTGDTFPLATTQHHHSMEGRDFVRLATLGEGNTLHFEHPVHEHEPGPDDTLYPGFPEEVVGRNPHQKVPEGQQGSLPILTEHDTKGHAWGMVVNLNTCIGCNACVTACQAENNIVVVGKDQVIRGREMHWINIDRYFEGNNLDEPEVLHQPRLCMHCENAPCELVCPVAATVHDAEGINTMVYNRCVGTRYCANNCPYKVRRFNFYQFADLHSPTEALLHNPEVTVRARGVMEKCTFCIQRINQARYAAEIEGRRIRDGEVVTACQGACPTRAITFGDINDPSSQVARLKESERNYGMLTELNTRPRVTYLAKLRNPNPEIEPEPRDGV